MIHDVLHTDAAFRLLADRLPDDDDLTSQPALSEVNGIGSHQKLLLEKEKA